MSVSFRPAIRENVNLWINLIGGTGSGKSYTAMRVASGISPDKPFAVIDTENRRALHYSDSFRFDHAELRPPFRPQAYADAVEAADREGYPVIVIDSGSHVWAGDGGILDWQEQELDEMVKRAAQRNDSRPEWQIREAGKMSAWIKPKMGHKHMVNKLLQAKAHIILCLRAEEKIEMVNEKRDLLNRATFLEELIAGKHQYEGSDESAPSDDDKSKWRAELTAVRSQIKDAPNGTKIIPKRSLTGKGGWIPICEKTLPFEATCSFLLLAANPGVPHPIKLQEQHRALFPPNQAIDETAGQRIAAWAAGAQSRKDSPAQQVTPNAPASATASVTPTTAAGPAAAAGPTADEALLIKAREWAESGTERYKKFWEGLTKDQCRAIGEARHAEYKALASKVPA